MARGRCTSWQWWAASQQQVALSPGDTRPRLRRRLWDRGHQRGLPFSRAWGHSAGLCWGVCAQQAASGPRWATLRAPAWPDIRASLLSLPCPLCSKVQVGTTGQQATPLDGPARSGRRRGPSQDPPRFTGSLATWGTPTGVLSTSPKSARQGKEGLCGSHPLWPGVLGGCIRSRHLRVIESKEEDSFPSSPSLMRNLLPRSPRQTSIWDPTRQQGGQLGLNPITPLTTALSGWRPPGREAWRDLSCKGGPSPQAGPRRLTRVDLWW